MMCGTEPYPTDFKAKKYKLSKQALSKVFNCPGFYHPDVCIPLQDDFINIMKNLPVPVPDEDIEEMFEFADKNNDGKLSYNEFEVSIATVAANITNTTEQVMIRPQAPPEVPKPHVADIGMNPQVFSPPTPQEGASNFASPMLPTPRGTYSSRSSLASFSTQGKRQTVGTSSIVKTSSTRSSITGTGSNPQIAHL